MGPIRNEKTANILAIEVIKEKQTASAPVWFRPHSESSSASGCVSLGGVVDEVYQNLHNRICGILVVEYVLRV